MGILNVTPDSFSDGGLYTDHESAVLHGHRMVDDGAALIDVGGESTRPGSDPVDTGIELERVVTVVRTLSASGIAVSVDTSKPEVAAAALEAGAEVVNDVTGLGDPSMRELVEMSGSGVVVMHMQGTPRDMQADPTYQDVVAEVESFLLDRSRSLIEIGVDPKRIAIDPGIGFGKTLEHNLSLLSELARISSLGHPVVLGTSRKGFLGTLTGIESPSDRDQVTAVTTALGYRAGARVFRVHDVVSSRHALEIATAISAER